MKLWTIIADHNGASFVAQYRAPSMSEALNTFATTHPSAEFFDFTVDEDFFDAVPVQKTQSVWCTTTSDVSGENSVTIYIVATAPDLEDDTATAA
ncbi:hypothetical protein [Chachezhania sediminis]|uniref:hypothetical protein n=1 Tax=Chachezhania sediminis TaxID=2599291 RepID=UPI00131B92BA|nr:hypothetical protein [Chachezhania sediminis]